MSAANFRGRDARPFRNKHVDLASDSAAFGGAASDPMGFACGCDWQTGSDRGAGGIEWLLRRVRVLDRQSARESARCAGGGGERTSALREIYSESSRCVSFRHAAWDHAGESGAGLVGRAVPGGNPAAVLRAVARLLARLCHFDLGRTRVRRNYFHAHRVWRARSEVHGDCQPVGGLTAIGSAARCVLLFV